MVACGESPFLFTFVKMKETVPSKLPAGQWYSSKEMEHDLNWRKEKMREIDPFLAALRYPNDPIADPEGFKRISNQKNP